MKYRYLIVFALIAAYLVSLELGLEYRAIHKGFSAHFLNNYIKDTKGIERKQEYPYHSPEIKLEKSRGDVRFWMASGSYALGKTIEDSFPNVFCNELINDGTKCQMINAARPGYTIKQNIKQLEEDAIKWKPDYVILYSMSLDIEMLSYQFLGGKSVNIEIQNTDVEEKIDISISDFIEREIEYTTLYSHLRRFVGGSILLASLLYDDMGDDAANLFKKTLEDFIRACEMIEAEPILTTFAVRFNHNNISQISYDGKLWLMRYGEHLSPKGWVDTINKYNEIIRQVAEENNLICVDVEDAISGQQEHFTDFVHFTNEGHHIVGKKIAEGFIQRKQ